MGERLELRLKSPVGAEPAVYPWPLPVYVSMARPRTCPAPCQRPRPCPGPGSRRAIPQRRPFPGSVGIIAPRAGTLPQPRPRVPPLLAWKSNPQFHFIIG